MADKARVFFALWPQVATAAAIDAAANGLVHDGRRVQRSQLHLTLAFVGSVEPRALAELEQRAQAIQAAAFTLVLDRADYFRRPRIVSLGPSRVPQALTRLADAVAGIAGVDACRRHFRPHVSLARRAAAPAPGRIAPIRWPVRSFCLVESGADGVPGRYVRLREWPLA